MTGIRIGHAEREAASGRLSDHYADGRLDDEEYAERLDAIWSARTHDDLALLFHDLPVPVKSAQPRTAGRNYRRQSTLTRRRSRGARVPVLAILLGLVILGVLVGIPWWVLLIVGLVLLKGGCR